MSGGGHRPNGEDLRAEGLQSELHDEVPLCVARRLCVGQKHRCRIVK